MSNAVWGKSKITGQMEILSHEWVIVREYKYIYHWFSGKRVWTEEKILRNKEGYNLWIASEAWESGNYSDVWMIHDNLDPEGWHSYCCSCDWKNGKFCNFALRNTSSVFSFYPYG